MLVSKEYPEGLKQARLAQSVERQALNLVVGGSSPPVGDSFFHFFFNSKDTGISINALRVKQTEREEHSR